MLELEKELDEEKKARARAERVNQMYRDAFTWLEEQEWFANNRHKLKNYIQRRKKK